RLTAQIASQIADELEPLGSTPVRLEWGGADELALSEPNVEQLRTLAGGEALQLLPLADWRSLVAPTLPDECFALFGGDLGAVAENRGYLDVQLHEPGWELQRLGIVLNAARAALLAESVEAGEPVLPLTMAAAGRALGERLPAAAALADEAAAEYRLRRREG